MKAAKNTMSLKSLKALVLARLALTAADGATREYVRMVVGRAPNKKWLKTKLLTTTWLFPESTFLHS